VAGDVDGEVAGAVAGALGPVAGVLGAVAGVLGVVAGALAGLVAGSAAAARGACDANATAASDKAALNKTFFETFDAMRSPRREGFNRLFISIDSPIATSSQEHCYGIWSPGIKSNGETASRRSETTACGVADRLRPLIEKAGPPASRICDAASGPYPGAVTMPVSRLATCGRLGFSVASPAT
jgi:hypothetical protein